MSRLNKSLQDYFQIPILLRAVGDTHHNTLLRFESLLNQHFSQVEIEQKDCAQLAESMKDFLRSRRDSRTIRLKFMAKDFSNDWPEFQVIYRCHIVIAIYEGKQNDPARLKEHLLRLNKQMQDERRKLVKLLVMNLEDQRSRELEIEKHFLFFSEVPEENLAIFLEPTVQEFTKEAMISFAEEIRKLRAEDNDYIVFNKNEERPEARYLKKRKRGRCLKLAGDYCLVLLADEDALSFYKEAMSALKSCDDYHWMMGVEQGRAAANLLKCIQIPRILGSEEDSEEYIKSLNQFMSNAIQLARKAKMPHFESECYFKTINSHRDIGNRSGVDEWTTVFVTEALRNYVHEEQVICLSELALIFEAMGMLRKRNYYMCCAAGLSVQRKPQVSKLLLSYVKDNSPALPQWEELYMLLLRELTKCGINDQQLGVLQCTLLSSCRRKLNLMEVGELVTQLNYNLLDNVDMPVTLLQLQKVAIEESPRKPKENRIGKPQKDSGVIAPWRRLVEYKYQLNEHIKFLAVIENPLPVPLSIKYRLASEPPNNSNYSSVYLEASKPTAFTVDLTLDRLDHYRIHGLTVQLWHFRFVVPLPKEIRVEVYDASSDYVIDCPEELVIERSSPLNFKFELRNLNQVSSSKLKLNVSVYYTVETGLQQNIFVFGDDKPPSTSSITVECKESQLRGCSTEYKSPEHIVMELEQLRVHRSLLKKLEIGVDYIQNDGSKYQISDLKVVSVSFRDSITCQVVRATELVFDTCRNYYEDKRVIASHFFAFVRVSKQPDDLKAYRMQLLCGEECVDEFILSERIDMLRQLKLKKQAVKKPTSLHKIWKQFILVRWECITNPQQHGQFFAAVNPDLRKRVIVASSKNVSMWFHADGKKLEEDVVRVARNSILTLHYKVLDESPSPDCSHEVVLHSRGVKERNIGCAIEGKTKQHGSLHLTNQLDIEFENCYATFFLVGLHFAEEIYLSERQILCGE